MNTKNNRKTNKLQVERKVEMTKNFIMIWLISLQIIWIFKNLKLLFIFKIEIFVI